MAMGIEGSLGFCTPDSVAGDPGVATCAETESSLPLSGNRLAGATVTLGARTDGSDGQPVFSW